ncbi:MAG: AAA family ATPase [Saprospiraceae bacterium]|nr:AAA family ATPase [Saprospiraceae bacterium]
MTFTPLQVSPIFHEILDRLEHSPDNLFITGRAGTGKSTLLRLFAASTRKKTVVVAPTGVAALQAGGQTIHSFFGFPPHLFGPHEVKKSRYAKMYQRIEVLVIDEISMLRADLVDRIDLCLRINRASILPFGGVQLVMFGDLFQLPPVVTRDEGSILHSWGYDSPYFFSAKCLQPPYHWDKIELQEVYRQQEKRFLRLLEDIRTHEADADTLAELNERVDPLAEPGSFSLILAARNYKVDRINQGYLEALPGPERVFNATITGKFNASVYPTDALLRLREGAQVMFIRNDPESAFVNGTIGVITGLATDHVMVSIPRQGQESRTLKVSAISWEIIRYGFSAGDGGALTRDVVGTFEQLPLRLAWAVTIHKSQGQTFDKVILDLSGGMFEHGQLYVALSRCRTLDGISLRQPIRPQDIRVDERVVDFYMNGH